MKDSIMDAIPIFHTMDIILADNSKFSFIGSILEAMFRDVLVESKLLEDYRKIPILVFCPLNDEM